MSWMESPPVAATIWGCAMSVFANVCGQLITAHKTNAAYAIDWIPVFRYLLFTLVSTAPNFYWQDMLEKSFPQYIQPHHPKKTDEKNPPAPKFSVRNTITKFILDQTIGSILNTLAFTSFFGAMRMAMEPSPRITSPFKAASYWVSPRAIDFEKVDMGEVWAQSMEQLWPITKAAWKLWPAVSLVNFTLVKTVEMRGLVGGLAGIGWGIYMSIVARG